MVEAEKLTFFFQFCFFYRTHDTPHKNVNLYQVSVDALYEVESMLKLPFEFLKE